MSATRPNVLVIMQDQLRADLVHGDVVATPTLDRLRHEGTTFTNAYTPTSLCGPARASLFTGLFPHTHGVLNNVSGPDAVSRNLSDAFPTVAAQLAAAGYRTGHVGKWHVGVECQAGDYGFADVELADQVTWAFPPDLTGEEYLAWAACFALDNPNAHGTRPRPPHPRLADRFPRWSIPMFSTDIVDEEVIPARGVLDKSTALLERYAASEEPFFLVASFLEPHWPNVLPATYHDRYDPAAIEPWPNFEDDFAGKPGAHYSLKEHASVESFTWADWQPVLAYYFGAISFIDDLAGRLLARLADLGLVENTIVLATADHGDLAGSHGLFNKGPVMYEETYRVPFIWRGPGVDAGAQSDSLVSLVDIAPTLLDLAGAKAPEPLHGISLAGELAGDRSGRRESLLCEFHGLEYGLYSQRMLRHDRYKLVYNPHDRRELYDLEADPAELVNLADRPELLELRRDLEARLLEVMFDSKDILFGTASCVLG